MTIWPKDRNGCTLEPGKTVMSPTGHIATIVFANYALRWKIDGFDNLDRNGSLVFCERWKPKDFEVINE